MTSPYSSTLLHEAPVERAPMPRPVVTPAYAAPTYAPAPYMQQPQQQYIVRQSSGGSKAANALMGLAVLLVVALVAVAGFFLAQQRAPQEAEIAAYQNIAARTGFIQGQRTGMIEGRNFARESQAQIVKLKAAIARQKAYNRAYRIGKRQGLASTRNRGYGYGGYRGYSRPYYGRSYSSSAGQVSSAIASAQALANATGAPVDVEVY